MVALANSTIIIIMSLMCQMMGAFVCVSYWYNIIVVCLSIVNKHNIVTVFFLILYSTHCRFGTPWLWSIK